MRFEVPFPRENLTTLMRRCGYAPEGSDEKTGELRFSKFLGWGGRYPRFHLYCRTDEKERKAFCNIHVDQKQPSYRGTPSHGGEYEGELVEQEASRIAAIIEKEQK